MKTTTCPEYLDVTANGPICQPDAKTCQSVCIHAAIGGEISIADVRQALLNLGNPGDPAVMAQYLRKFFGDRYELNMKASIDDIRSLLAKGCLLIIHGYFTTYGHVICLDGLTEGKIHVMDPWDEFEAISWSYPEKEESFAGEYSDLLVYAACVAGFSAADAAKLYTERTIDRAEKGAWIHIIRPS
jgi:hypothetical protein